MVANAELIADLLERWSEARGRGEALSAAQLCRDHPELLQEMERQLTKLEKMAWLESPEPAGEIEFLTASRMDSRTLHVFSEQMMQAALYEEIQLPSLDVFHKSLLETGLVSQDDYSRLFPASGESVVTSTNELASELVRLGKLTSFQVQMLARGKGKQLILGNYILLEKLGAGGMGQVFKARHRRMKRVVALKLLPDNLVNSPQAVDRFRREVEATAKLEHPHIVTAHDADEADGRHFLAMQFIDGADLLKIVQASGPLSVGQGIHLLTQAAQGLQYAHQRGVIHRDIKPSNLLIDAQGDVKILDMGLARIEAATGELPSKSDLTRDGMVMGTVNYMAPEQAENTHLADERSDVYSLGCTLYFVLTGQNLYRGTTLMAKLIAHREQPIPLLKSNCSDAPATLVSLFESMVAKKPETRTQSMAAVLTALKPIAHLAIRVEGCRVGESIGIGIPSDVSPLRDTSSAGIDNTIPHAPFVKPAEPETPSPVPMMEPPPRRHWQAVIVGLALLGLIAYFLAPLVFRVESEHGDLIVEIDDPEVEVVIRQGGVTVVDKSKKREFLLKAGDGEVLIFDRETGLEVASKRFSLKSGKRETVSARMSLPLAKKKDEPAKKDETPAPKEKITAKAPPQSDQAAAEWVQKQPPDKSGRMAGGAVRVSDGTLIDFQSKTSLPKEAFHLVKVYLPRCPEDLSPLAGLPLLEQVNLHETPLTTNIIDSLGDLPNLHTLGLMASFAEDSTLAGLGRFPKLRSLGLGSPELKPSHVASLKKLPQLESFHFENIRIGMDELVAELETWPKLKRIQLSPLPHPEYLIPFLAKARALEELRINNTDLRKANIELLGTLPLRMLDLNGSTLDAKQVGFLSSLRDLEELTVSAPVVSPLVKAIDGLPRLKKLALDYAGVSDPDLAGLSKMASLREVSLRGHKLSEDALLKFRRANPHCEIQISGSAMFDPERTFGHLPGRILDPRPLSGIKRWQMLTRTLSTGPMTAAWSPDGKYLALGFPTTQDGVRVLDGDTLELVRVFPAHGRSTRVAWSPDSQRLCVTSTTHPAAMVWNLNGTKEAEIISPIHTFFHLAWGPGEFGLVLATDGDLLTFNAKGKAGTIYKGHASNRVPTLAWSKQGRLASTGVDRKLIFWKPEGSPEKVIDLPGDASDLAWNDTGEYLAVSLNGSTTSIFTDKGEKIREVPIGYAATGYHRLLAWVPGQNVVMSWGERPGGNPGQGLNFWNIDGKHTDLVFPYGHMVTSTAFRPDGKRLAFVGAVMLAVVDHTDKGWQNVSPWPEWWNGQPETHVAAFNLLRLPLPHLWSPDAKSFVVTWAGDCTHWDATGKAVQRFQLPGKPSVSQGIWHPKKPLVAFVQPAEGGVVHLADGSRNFKVTKAVRDLGGSLSRYGWSPEGDWLAVYANHEVRLISEDGKRGPTLGPIDVGDLAWSPDGKTLAILTTERKLVFWDIGGKEKQEWPLRGVVDCIAWSPKGDQVVIAGPSMEPAIHDRDGKVVRVLPGQRGAAHALRWTSEGQVISYGQYTVRWEAATGKLLGWDLLPRFGSSPYQLVACNPLPDGKGVLATYNDAVRVLSDENHRVRSIFLPVNFLGDSISYRADGSILDKTPNADRYIVYLVENEDGTVETLNPEQFHARTKNALLPEITKARDDRKIAEWARSLGATLLISQEQGGKLKGTSLTPDQHLPDSPISLVTLDFTQAKKLTDADLAKVRDLPNLQYLNLSNLPIGDAGIQNLAQLPRLREIYLDRTKIGDESCKHLARFSTLVEIRMEDTAVTAAGVDALRKALPGAKVHSSSRK